ncbi:putative PurR-regulated permease PerM [Alteromonadaceae bacterium 2753L.S.0a.02]|nr:putative PurR-regulated permease PerM [Alteromonadaceae bacterium 2753L.S.0a.02]
MVVKKLSGSESSFVNMSLEAVVRIAIVLMLLVWCFDILKPFILPLVWGIIIAVASHKLFIGLCNKLGGRTALAAVVYTLAGLALIILPAAILSSTLFSGLENLSSEMQAGRLIIPPPPQGVSDWPVIGEKLYAVWLLFSENLDQAFEKFAPQITAVGNWTFERMKNAGSGILQFIISIIIAGVLQAKAQAGQKFIHDLVVRLAGDSGITYCDLAGRLIQSVTQGILGVAIIQAILAGIGFSIAGVPAAGLWAFVVLFLAVIQVGPMIVILPLAIYMMGEMSTLPGIVFLVYCIAVAMLDNFLKPMLLSRGIDAPMVVVFLGAIGGFISMGILGLFIGAIVLVLGWVLLIAWIHEDSEAMAVGILEQANEAQNSEENS